jgi:hypothetical protein
LDKEKKRNRPRNESSSKDEYRLMANLESREDLDKK